MPKFERETRCLYRITFPDGKAYIGITSNFKKRMRSHRQAKTLIGDALRKFGFKNCTAQILVWGTSGYILELERTAIRHFGTLHPHGFNANEGGSGGPINTTLFREKMRLVKLGKKLSPQHRESMRLAHLNQTHTPETKLKMKVAALNRPKEHNEKIAKSLIGRKCSLETRAKISASRLARRHV